MNEYLDIYCERVIPGLWSEPLNAVSNLAFFLAAWAIWKLCKGQPPIPTGLWILISLAISVGIGSTLFHTFATQWAMLLDIIPILLFQLWFLWLYSRQVIKMNYGYTVALLVSFFLVSNFSKQFSNLLNGSLAYAPTLLILLILGFYHYQQQKREPLLLLAAAGTFMLALSFRTLDLAICPYFALGTHFLWHLCNGILLYLSARALILNWSTQVARV